MLDILHDLRAEMQEGRKNDTTVIGAPTQAYQRAKPLYDYLELLQKKLDTITKLPEKYAATGKGTFRAIYEDLHRLPVSAEGPKGRIKYCVDGIINKLVHNARSSKRQTEEEDLDGIFETEMRELFRVNSWDDVEVWIADLQRAVEAVAQTFRQPEPVRTPDGLKSNAFPAAADVYRILAINSAASGVTGIPVFLQAEEAEGNPRN